MILQMTRPVQGGLKQERKTEIVSNNLANSSVNGFKRDILSFDEKMNAMLTVDQRQGEVKHTGNKLDLALADEGFFSIATQRGEKYTRDGSFSINLKGELITQNGDIVLGKKGAIVIDGQNVSIDEKGRVYIDNELKDTLKIVTFSNLEKLQKEGSSLLAYKGQKKEIITPKNILVEQHSLETSNNRRN